MQTPVTTPPSPPSPPIHGGDLTYAEACFGKPLLPWQDLSTGISPWAYPAPPVPEEIWQRLPGSQQPLLDAAARYYATTANQLLALPGSQFAISRLAALFTRASIAIPNPGYREHLHHWQAAGHRIYLYQSAAELSALVAGGKVEHALVINPNNPSGLSLPPAELVPLLQQLRGYLLLDEAFADYQPELSASALLGQYPRLLILRSLGKFFGLAGIRLGFLLGQGAPFNALAQQLDPWAISSPALWLGEMALRDSQWQAQQRLRIQQAAQQQQQLLTHYLGGQFSLYNGGLFFTLRGSAAPLYALYQCLAEQGIFTRWCYEQPTADNRQPQNIYWLRLGLAADGGARLEQALRHFVQTAQARETLNCEQASNNE